MNRFDHIETSISFFDALASPFSATSQEINWISGHLCVSIVTSYEIMIKNSILMFIDSHGGILSEYVKSRYGQINARLKNEQLKTDFLEPLGGDYLESFKRRSRRYEHIINKKTQPQGSQSLNNLVLWRHGFVHGGVVGGSLRDVKKAHNSAKYIILAYLKTLET